MKLNTVYSKQEFNKIHKFMPSWNYDEEYTDEEIDSFDEEIEDVLDSSGYITEDGIFLTNMIDKLRTIPEYWG
ncbi:hypothetical protein A9Y57_00148 [Streptococcus parauberis]|uniref:Uncharacterized protein n=1 Tax=Streptococcus parauberis TaxID=1348 RepID=A0A854WFV2_9STRE|nr:hypothetical protein [Streptococcus parauberis]PCH13879.1 hypothetical protein A9Y57_00514 [Streptococcus parauberis]PCH14145.1 hypothetical protein A9Y57_00148 [Streptococcus parauberis]